MPPSSRPPEPIDQSTTPSYGLVIEQAASARRAAASHPPGHCPHVRPISATNSFGDVDRRRLQCDIANEKNTALAVLPLVDGAVLARRNRQKSMTTPLGVPRQLPSL